MVKSSESSFDFEVATRWHHQALGGLDLSNRNIDHMLTLRMVLIWFEAVSGLKINLGKSELVAVGAVHNMEIF